jgi:valyl-tRNA synthetase
MPFITEELWHVVRAEVKAEDWPDSVLAASYPQKGTIDEAAERRFGPVIGIIDAIRNVRGEMNIQPKAEPRVTVAVAEADVLATIQGEAGRIARLARASLEVMAGVSVPAAPQSAVAVGPGFELRVHLAGVLDVAAELARVDKELAKVEGDLTGVDRKLANPSFVQKAPVEVVEKDRARAAELREKRSKLDAHRAMLSGTEANLARREPMENNEMKPVADPAPAAAQPAPAAPPAPAAAPAVEPAPPPAPKAAKPAPPPAPKAAKPAPPKAAKPAAKPAKAKKPVAKKPVAKAKKAPVKKASRKIARKPARKVVARKPAMKVARKLAKKRK